MVTAPTARDVRRTLRQHILESFVFTDDPSALNDGESFLESRIIDSMGMMRLIQFIERSYGFQVEESDMTPERLDSVDRLVSFIVEKTGGRP